MTLNEMYLSSSQAEELFNKLEKYNEEHPEEKITAQKLAEKLLNYAIKYIDVKEVY